MWSSRSLIIDNPNVEFDKNYRVFILNWNNSWDTKDVESLLFRIEKKSTLVHVLSSHTIVSLKKMSEIFFIQWNHIYFFSEPKSISREERFEIATFLGEKSLRRINPNQKLRELYKYWSYAVMANLENLSEGQAALLDGEKHLAPSMRLLSKHQACK
jgi:hypothetical protein